MHQIGVLTGQEVGNAEDKQGPPNNSELNFLDQILYGLHGLHLVPRNPRIPLQFAKSKTNSNPIKFRNPSQILESLKRQSFNTKQDQPWTLPLSKGSVWFPSSQKLLHGVREKKKKTTKTNLEFVWVFDFVSPSLSFITWLISFFFSLFFFFYKICIIL